MQLAEKSHPEWGYLAPAPSFMRTVRIVAVATAIGATAGAAVVLSLVERPAARASADSGKTLVVVHSLVQPAEAAAPASVAIAPVAPPIVAAPVAAQPAAPAVRAQANAQSPVTIPPAAPPAAIGQATAPAPSDSGTAPATEPPANVATLGEAPPAGEAGPAQDADQTMIAPDQLDPQKRATSKQHTAEETRPSTPVRRRTGGPNLGSLFRHLFNSHAGSSY
jgi:hypothetical protein